MVQQIVVARTIQLACPQKVKDLLAKATSDLIELSPTKEGNETCDVACLERNYETIYGVCDLLKCEPPTAYFCRGVMKELDDTIFEGGLSHMKTATARKAWQTFEGDKLQIVLSFANRHFASKKNRAAMPRSLKVNLLKELWRKHRHDIFDDDLAVSDQGGDVLPPLAISSSGDLVSHDVGQHLGAVPLPSIPDVPDFSAMLNMPYPESPASSGGDNSEHDTTENIFVLGSDEELPEVVVPQPSPLQAQLVPKPVGVDELVDKASIEPESFPRQLPRRRKTFKQSEKKENKRGKAFSKAMPITDVETPSKRPRVALASKTPSATPAVETPSRRRGKTFSKAMPITDISKTPSATPVVETPSKRPAPKRFSDDELREGKLRVYARLERKVQMYQVISNMPSGKKRSVFIANANVFGSNEKAQRVANLAADLFTKGLVNYAALPFFKEQVRMFHYFEADGKRYSV